MTELVVRVTDGVTLGEVAAEIDPLVKKVQAIDLRRYAGREKEPAKETIREVVETLRQARQMCETLRAASEVGRLWE